MKVLHVLHSIERSGAEVMLGQAAPLFRERGVELYALATGDSIGPYAPVLAQAGFVLHHLRCEPSATFLADFFRFVRRGRFDVVHLHTERAFFWYGLLARLAGVPRVVRTVHSVFDFRGTLWLERCIQRRLAGAVLGERVVAPGVSVQEAEERIYGVHPLLVANWTDPVRFAPAASVEERANARAALGVDDEAVVYVSVGSCSPVKNHDAVIRAVAGIASACPHARYLHVGSGDLEPSERRLAESLGLLTRVTFAGQRDDMPRVFRAADVLVMPSSREGLPVSCLEAMSCGLPVIAADVPGLRDLVVESETGILVHGQDGLTQAMARLYDDERLRALMGSSGRARVLSGHSLENGVAGYMRVYQGA